MRQAIASGVLACALFTGSAAAFSQENSPYVLGRAPSALYRVDVVNGFPRSVSLLDPRGLSLERCAGLAWDLQDRLRTLCRENDDLVLVVLDPETADVLSREVLPVDDDSRTLTPADLVLRPADGVLFALSIGITLTAPVPLFANIGRLSGVLPSGEILGELSLGPDPREEDFVPSGIAFSPSGGPAFILEPTTNGPALRSLDPVTGQEGSPQLLSQQGDFQDLAFDPRSGRLLAIWDEFGSSQLGTIGEDGTVSVIAPLPFRARSIAFRPESKEWILPALVAIQAGERMRIQSSLNLANFSDGIALNQLEIFDSEGTPTALGNVACSSDLPADPASFEILPRSQTAVTIGGAKAAFSGWARLRSTGPGSARPQVELSLLRASAEDCPQIDSVPSDDVLTSVELAAVRPGLEFSAAGAITDFRESAFSLVNPSATETAVINVVATREDGSSFDANEIHLQPGRRLSLLLFELLIEGKDFLLPPVRPNDFRGQIRFSSDVPFAVGAQKVLLPDGTWTELTVVAR